MTTTQKLLLLLIAYIPFQLALNLAPDIDLASGRVFILMVFGLWILGSLASKKFKIVSHSVTYLILFFLFLSLLSLTQGVSLERGLRKILVFASCFPIYFLVTGAFTEAKPLRARRGLASVNKVVEVMVFSGLILAIIGLVQFFSQFLFGIESVYQFWARFAAPIFLGKTFTAAILANPSWLVDIGGKTFLRATSLFPDPHMLSFYLGLVIPLAFVSLFYCKKKGVARHAPTKFFLLIVAQLLTFSRGGYLGMVITLPLMVLFLWKTLGLKARISIVIFTLIGFVIVFTLGLPVVNRATSILDFKEPSTFGRFLIWRDALDIFRDSPFLGVGIGSYSYLINPAVSYRAPIYAHNTYLDIAVEMGIFALIVWIGIFAAAIGGLWRIYRKRGELNILSIGLMGSLVWFSIHALVDTPIYSPRILPMLMVILGLSIVIIKTNK